MTQESNTSTSVAQSNNLPQAPEQVQSGGWTSLVPMLLIFVVFYFLLIKPQEKKRKQQEQLVSTVKPGEEVITHSGICGKVVRVNENDGTAVISTENNTELKILKSSIADIPSRKSQATKPAPKTDNKATKSTSVASEKIATPTKAPVAVAASTASKKPLAKPAKKTTSIPSSKPTAKVAKKPLKKAK